MITNRVLILLLALAFTFTGLSAQNYVGVNKATLTTQGAETVTSWTANQVVSKFLSEKNQLTLMVKTHAFQLGATAEEIALFQAAFIPDANRLLQIELDLSSLGLVAGSSKEIRQIDVPGQIRFNDQLVKFRASFSNLRYSPQTLEADLSLSLSFRALGLAPPTEHEEKIGGDFNLLLPTLSLPVR